MSVPIPSDLTVLQLSHPTAKCWLTGPETTPPLERIINDFGFSEDQKPLDKILVALGPLYLAQDLR